MVMLVIGALLIGYLIYFAATSLRHWSRMRAVSRRDDEMNRKGSTTLPPFAPPADHVEKLEARIAVLERLIAEPAEPDGAGPDHPAGHRDRRNKQDER